MKVFLVSLLGICYLSYTMSTNIYKGVLDSLSNENEEKKEKTVNKTIVGTDGDTNGNSYSELLHNCQSRLKVSQQENIACMTKTCPSDGIAFFKQFIRRFSEAMRPLQYNANSLGTKLVLTKEQFDEMQTILKSDNSNAKEILDLFDQYKAFQPLVSQMSISIWSEIRNQLNITMVIAAVVGLIMLWLASTLLKRTILQGISWRHRIMLVVFTLFLFSIPWEWFRMYKVALSKKTSTTMKEMPPECSAKDLTTWKSISLWFSKQFTFSDDRCAAYHESLLVDPFWEVSPLQATAVCLSRFFFEPMKYFSAALGESFKLFFKEIPAQWQPFLLIAIIVIILVFMIIISGLKIETPLLKINVNPRPEIRYLPAPHANLRHAAVEG